MKLVGITGGIGSGKSLVADLFRIMGATVYDSDEEAKKLMTSNNEIISDIKKLFGSNSYNEKDELNRSYIREIVFQDPAKLKQLNHIVHGAVRRDFQIWSKKQSADIILFESALILDPHWIDLFDKLIYVYADESIRIERVQRRDNISKEMIQQIILSQKTDKDLLEDPKVIWIDNSGQELLIPKVWKLFHQILIA